MKLKVSNYKPMIILYSILISLFFIYPSKLMAIILLLSYAVILACNTYVGLLLIVMIIPFHKLLQENLESLLFGLNPLLLIWALLLIKYILEISNKHRNIIYHKDTIVFSYSFILINFLSLFLNFSNIPLVTSYYGQLIISIIILIAYVNLSIYSKEFYDLFIFTILMTSLLLCFLVSPNILLVLQGDNRRLNILGSIRNLTSIIAPSMIISSYLLFYKEGRMKMHVPILKNKLFLVFINVYAIIVLLLTGSRGTIYALLISYIIMLLFNYKFKINIKRLLVLTITVLIIIFCMRYINLPSAMERLLSIESDTRGEIWKNAFDQLTVRDLIFGRGLNRFKELSRAGGYVSKYTDLAYYAHSIYIDILFSSGIVSLVIFLKYLTSFIQTSIGSKSRLGLTLLTFTLIAYFTHGESISLTFWLSLGLIAGANKWYINDI